ncbi:hypothetical protein [Pokkaliibacter plantistimulans]|uniref:hypothetical protein n=1 Tax=Pokkaliibacter plantistimulans TaxID=1635171 RepID=UPI001057D4A2|nr:hypothetical protein [Pokkaliibacter plantistimulans]
MTSVCSGGFAGLAESVVADGSRGGGQGEDGEEGGVFVQQVGKHGLGSSNIKAKKGPLPPAPSCASWTVLHLGSGSRTHGFDR